MILPDRPLSGVICWRYSIVGGAPHKHDHQLSDCCLVDHIEWLRKDGQRPKMSPKATLQFALLCVDRNMHFTGVRGAIWRFLGVDRSLKNPNLCNT